MNTDCKSKVKLIGLDTTTDSTFGAEVAGGDVDAALVRLFNKALHGPVVSGPRRWAWAPGDVTAVFVGQTKDARPHYLHVSFSDRREWFAAA